MIINIEQVPYCHRFQAAAPKYSTLKEQFRKWSGPQAVAVLADSVIDTEKLEAGEVVRAKRHPRC